MATVALISATAVKQAKKAPLTGSCHGHPHFGCAHECGHGQQWRLRDSLFSLRSWWREHPFSAATTSPPSHPGPWQQGSALFSLCFLPPLLLAASLWMHSQCTQGKGAWAAERPHLSCHCSLRFWRGGLGGGSKRVLFSSSAFGTEAERPPPSCRHHDSPPPPSVSKARRARAFFLASALEKRLRKNFLVATAAQAPLLWMDVTYSASRNEGSRDECFACLWLWLY